MWNMSYQEEDFNVCDGIRAIVKGECSKGLFLELDNGQEAFASFGGLKPGTKVLCTILKKATEKWRVLVAIDSVLDSVAVT